MRITCVESPMDSMTITELRGANVRPGMDGLLKVYYANDDDDYCVIVGQRDEDALFEMLKHRREQRESAFHSCAECGGVGAPYQMGNYHFCSAKCCGAFVGVPL